MTARYNHIQINAHNPMLSASNGYTGLDLVLWSIRFGSYTIAAGLACFWFVTVEARYSLHFVFIAAGAVLLLMILVKYVQTRRELKAWTWVYAIGYTRRGSSATRAYRLDGEPTPSSDSAVLQQQQQFRPKGVYDSWLLLRLCIAFACLCIFEFNTIIVQLTGHADMEADASRDAPDLSAERAKRDFALLMPGAIASVLAFITFGTTQQFRQIMYRTFLPKRWQQMENGEDGLGPRGTSRPPSRLAVAVMSSEHREHGRE
ncbi:hypothetical protein VMCG_09304 [Cytospora schulzeri]|uniref:Uncharacterized protein n=1 Tax=Cytospora schulzeri TaxID=448051 RepID=A0A423VMQ5_9PEZI|nr:hypothetical protein VMCG_09304 [Valsa malicola]